MFDSEKRLFVENKALWKPVCEQNYLIPSPCGVQEVEEGILLPLRVCKDIDTINAAFEGGVCDKNGKFIAGHERGTPDRKPIINLSCQRSYSVETPLHRRHETVVYGGVLFWHFGHMMTEGITRLWWLADHKETSLKIVFLDLPYGGGFRYHSILETMGLTAEQYEIIAEPTQFDNVIVPNESLFLWAGYHLEAQKIFDLMISKVTPGADKKVYLSRTQLEKQDGINEEYFESFYRNRGYRIVYPEQLPFSEQISILSGADEVVCTRGTLSLMIPFCRRQAKVIILERSPGFKLWPSYMFPIQMRNLDAYFVDVGVNFLPAGYVGLNTYFYGPTPQWKEFLDAQGITYDPEEISMDLHVKPYLLDYLVKWAQTYSRPGVFVSIKNSDIIDVINGIYRVFLNDSVDKKKFAERDDMVKLRRENAALKKNVETLEAGKKKLEEKLEEHSCLPEMIKQTLLDMGIPQTYEILAQYLPACGKGGPEHPGTYTAAGRPEVREEQPRAADGEDLGGAKPLRRFKAWLKRTGR